jgi:hypothetical protein
LQAYIKSFHHDGLIPVLILGKDKFLTETASSGSIDIALSKGG